MGDGSDFNSRCGFTLIELSIVLVIIGLIVGGVLVGQDLIRAAGVRATISQIEKYQTAVNTFRGKYGYLPGDIKDPDASNFGFAARGQYAGQGDGNGILQGVNANAANSFDQDNITAGESAVFWVDLSAAHLIDGTFTTASITTLPGSDVTNVDAYMPAAKMGKGMYIFVWSGGWRGCFSGNGNGDGKNYFGLQDVPKLKNSGGYGNSGQPYALITLTPQEAYNFDKKTDDGLPQSGRTVALGLSVYGPTPTCWASPNLNPGGAEDPVTGGPTTVATPGSATTCYDNNNVGGAQQQYSLGQSGGSNPACAVSFQFQ